ncbi:MAG: ATP-binding protein [Motiliproteus sp.]|nr:ATP-binding protein [Motiliproteus sp.]MCW9051361.1 ATP-binding protein [Motiliproteus sp.]
MFETSTVLLIFFAYMGGLFLVALLVERSKSLSQYLSQRPWIYALSITVYATSWTFYGSVGLASKSGLMYLPTYLGPTVAIGLWWILLRKMVRIKERRSITSIADFISARYDRSQGVAMIVTLIALLGTVPYIALQLKAVVTSFSIVTGAPETQLDWNGIGLWVTILLITFTVLFGARRLDPTERHQGMMAALAVECFVKLLAFLSVGIFVTYGLFNGFGDLLGALPEIERQQLTQVGDDQYQSYVRWMTVLLLSMAGILFLPRQFHTAVIENSNEEHIRTAIWLVPAYLLLISLFVVPLAAAGKVQGLPPQLAEFFVLLLPMQADQHFLSMLVFIGGLAAASGMIIVSSVTLATMSTNHLLVPLLNHFDSLHFLKRYLLPARWLAIACVLMFGYLFARELTEGRLLANIGILGFCAALQFVPAIVGGLFWLRGNKMGALLGLSAGFIIWFYTLMVPMLAQSGFVPLSWLTDGPLGMAWLRPEGLFGLDRFDSVTHAAFWSLFFNSGFYLLGSLLAHQKESELEMASAYVHALRFNTSSETDSDSDSSHIPKYEKVSEATALLEHYFSEKIARSKIRQITEGMGVLEKDMMSAGELLRFHRELERVLAGAIGAAAAHQAMKQHLSYSEVEHGQVSQVYAGILANLQLSPDELLERISYFEERDKAQRMHSRELEARVMERESEIRARRRAEKETENALKSQQLLNEMLKLSLQPAPLGVILRRALKKIFALSWLPTDPKGAVFLADRQQQTLHLKSQLGLDQLELDCSQIDFGHGLCGQAAELKIPLHSDDEMAVNSSGKDAYPDGHYAVPILADDAVLGVLIIYLHHGHQKHSREIQFLETVSHGLGGLIQRHRAEKELNRTQRWLQGILDNSTALIYLKDPSGRYLMVNEKFEQVIGKSESQLIGHLDKDLIDDVAAELLHENDQRVIETNQSEEVEEVYPQEDGVHTYLSMKFPLHDEQGKVIAVGNISTDISARSLMDAELQMAYSSMEQMVEERTAALSNTLIQMEKEIDERILAQEKVEKEKAEQKLLIGKLEEAQNQLLQSEKMAAIGQLAAGVAHEINNPVGYINSNLGTLRQYLEDLKKVLSAYDELELNPAAVSDILKKINALKDEVDFEFLSDDLDNLLDESVEGVDRVRKIVKDLKDFSHVDRGEWVIADIHTCLDSTLNVVWNELKYKAEVVKEYGDLPEVTCLASQLNQVFMNLLVNAAHAIKDRGQITIRTGTENDGIWVEIEDDGCGISEEQQKRIFEPFFTTKPVGKGTGLGLSLSYGIIEKHKGSIVLDSEPGRGTRFRVWIPEQPEEEVGDEATESETTERAESAGPVAS